MCISYIYKYNFFNTEIILKQLVASGSVITSLYLLRFRLSEYRLVITSPSATTVVNWMTVDLPRGRRVIGEDCVINKAPYRRANFSSPRSIVPKLVLSAFGQGKLDKCTRNTSDVEIGFTTCTYVYTVAGGRAKPPKFPTKLSNF